jgi:ribosomal protein S18 acetylase RimI-like enzyme
MQLIEQPTLTHYHRVLMRSYGADRQFVYPDIGLLAKLLNGKATYLQRGKARAFAVVDDEGAAAFGIAFVDPGLQQKMACASGSIGFFEAADAESAAHVLDSAARWLQQQGVTEILAPFNANPYNGMGCREDYFDQPPFIGCSHHHDAIDRYLSVAGYTATMHYLNFSVPLEQSVFLPYLQPLRSVTFRPMSRWHFRREIRHFVRLHNLAFRPVWGEVEISEAEAMQMLIRSRFALEPDFFQFACDGDAVVGFVLCMPDLGAVLAPLYQPMTSATGIWRIATRRHRAQSVGLLALGVDPAYQGHGIGTALAARACTAAIALGYRQFEYALVAEVNEASCATVERFGGEVCRRFAIYQRHLTTL